MANHPRATIVILGNDAATLDLIEHTLRESGDRVLATHDPAEAIELARHVRIDLLVAESDLLDGEYASFREEVPILYLGGHGGAAGEATLGVPFSLEDLRAAVEAALGRSA